MVLAVMKTAGIVFLVLVIILLALGALILFLPIGYRVDGDLDRKHVSVRLNWLFGLIRLMGGFGDEMNLELVILWFKIRLFPRDPEKDARKRERREARRRKKQKKKAEKARKKQKEQPEQRKMAEGEVPPGDARPADDAEQGETSGVKKALAAVHKIREICKAESTATAVPYILEQIKYLLYHYRPRKIQADVTFGMIDPSVTGRILGALGMACFIFAYDIEIHPVFETDELVLQGDVQIKGHMQMIYLVIIAIRLIRVKEVRRFFKVLIRQIRKK